MNVEFEELKYSELPERADLQMAVSLNQEVWRKRDRFLAASSPIEIPSRFTKPAFGRIFDRFGDYIDNIHLKHPPLVGYSVLPETSSGWGYGFYLEDYGNLRPLRLLEEFATDWLAEDIFGRDPLYKNCYLYKVIKELRNGRLLESEHLLLNGILRALKNRQLSKQNLTEIFASFVLAGDSGPLDGFVSDLTNGKRKNYTDCLRDSLVNERYTDVIKMTKIRSKYYKTILKPLAFTGHSAIQLLDSLRGIVGHVAFPGVINLSGYAFDSVTMAHESIHALSYRKDRHSCTPIGGYIMSYGIVFPDQNEEP